MELLWWPIFILILLYVYYKIEHSRKVDEITDNFFRELVRCDPLIVERDGDYSYFSIADSVIPDTFKLYINGVCAIQELDYTLDDRVVKWNAEASGFHLEPHDIVMLSGRTTEGIDFEERLVIA